jgi:hypothetical protein
VTALRTGKKNGGDVTKIQQSCALAVTIFDIEKLVPVKRSASLGPVNVAGREAL